MVPMWTVPIALVMGNCVVLKPSEQDPLTHQRVLQLAAEAGLPFMCARAIVDTLDQSVYLPRNFDFYRLHG